MSMQSKLNQIEKHLLELSTNINLPSKDKLALEKLRNLKSLLKISRKQVTFLGVFKAGKSTLINALVGQNISPSRTNRATGVVLRISYGYSPTSKIVSRFGNNITSSFFPLEDINQYILLDISKTVAKACENIDAVEVELPINWLTNNWCLADTPGLLDNVELSDRTYQELQQSDLVVMVLPIDKLLSQEERDTVVKLHHQLNGNIMFVVNRLDLVEQEERDEILNWVKTSLAGFGNRLVGNPCIFVTDAKAVLAYKTGKSTKEEVEDYLPGLIDLENTLKNIFTTSIGDRIVILSRIGIIKDWLQQTDIYFQSRILEVQQEIQTLQEAAEQDLISRTKVFNERISNIRLELRQACDEVINQQNNLVSNFKRKAATIINQHEPSWPKIIQENWNSYIHNYLTIIEQKFKTVLQEMNYTVNISHKMSFAFAPFLELKLDVDMASNIGDWIGDSSVMYFMRGVSKVVLGINLKEDNLRSINSTVDNSIIGINKELQKTFKQLESFLESYQQKNLPQLIIPSALTLNREYLKNYHQFIKWSRDFKNTLVTIEGELTSWQLQFEEEWDKMSKVVQDTFKSKYYELLAQDNKVIRLNDVINSIIIQHTQTWKNTNHYRRSWLNRLQQEDAYLAARFINGLDTVVIEKSIVVDNNWDDNEKSMLMSTSFLSVIILIFGFLYSLSIVIILTAIVIVIGGGVMIVNDMKKRRIQKTTEAIMTNIVEQMTKHGKRLSSLFKHTSKNLC